MALHVTSHPNSKFATELPDALMIFNQIQIQATSVNALPNERPTPIAPHCNRLEPREIKSPELTEENWLKSD